MKKYSNLKLTNKPKDLDEESFISRLQNGYLLFVEYGFEEGGQSFELHYELFRNLNPILKQEYILSIREIDPSDYDWYKKNGRKDRYIFSTPAKALIFLRQKEHFKISEWGYRKGPFMRLNKKQKE